MQAPVQLTVTEYVNEFFRRYNVRAYGKTTAANARGGAESLFGMFKLVLAKGGRDELHVALQSFKPQLSAALKSPEPARTLQIESLFALLSALTDTAERVHQFSPVKENISCAVLEEVRLRLYRIMVGDAFCDQHTLRRQALDLTFTSMLEERRERDETAARQNKLVVTGPKAKATSSTTGKSAPSSKGIFGVGGGPDVSSWEGLWNSLNSMLGKRMLPLLQSVMLDLHAARSMTTIQPASTLATGRTASPQPPLPLPANLPPATAIAAKGDSVRSLNGKSDVNTYDKDSTHTRSIQQQQPAGHSQQQQQSTFGAVQGPSANADAAPVQTAAAAVPAVHEKSTATVQRAVSFEVADAPQRGTNSVVAVPQPSCNTLGAVTAAAGTVQQALKTPVAAATAAIVSVQGLAATATAAATKSVSDECQAASLGKDSCASSSTFATDTRCEIVETQYYDLSMPEKAVVELASQSAAEDALIG